MKFFYNLGVNAYTLALIVASLWNEKAKKIIRGRRQSWAEIQNFKSIEHVYWFHCASLGEFEQGRPLMEALKSRESCQIVVTFFSPSGYEIRKNYEGADLVIYLPKDSRRNANRFLDHIQPKAVYFVKYEFWAHYILTTAKRKIPIYSVAALFRQDQIFFSPFGGFMRKVLRSFDKIFVQNEHSRMLLKEIEIEAVVCGDTRYDRVLKNAENVQAYSEIEKFKSGDKVLVCGSIWEEDLIVIQEVLSEKKNWKLIVAPHELSEKFISQIENNIKRKAIRYSSIDQVEDDHDMLIIDNIGMLMNLYQYGDAAYIGGAFKTGLHNILEPAAFGLPVIFGDKYDKFPEAFDFIQAGIGASVRNAGLFEAALEKLENSDLKEKVNAFMRARTGATEIILENN